MAYEATGRKLDELKERVEELEERVKHLEAQGALTKRPSMWMRLRLLLRRRHRA